MRIELKCPVTLGGKNYGKGVHEVHESMQRDWYFQHLIQGGELKILQRPAMIAVPDYQRR